MVLIEGDKVYSKLNYESALIGVRRVLQKEANGRIHTSAILSSTRGGPLPGQEGGKQWGLVQTAAPFAAASICFT